MHMSHTTVASSGTRGGERVEEAQLVGELLGHALAGALRVAASRGAIEAVPRRRALGQRAGTRRGVRLDDDRRGVVLRASGRRR
jgi:hypothetical protein